LESRHILHHILSNYDEAIHSWHILRGLERNKDVGFCILVKDNLSFADHNLESLATELCKVSGFYFICWDPHKDIASGNQGMLVFELDLGIFTHRVECDAGAVEVSWKHSERIHKVDLINDFVLIDQGLHVEGANVLGGGQWVLKSSSDLEIH
jgi:hypothetical protein